MNWISEINKGSLLKPAKRANKNFLQKNFCLLSEKTPRAGSFQRAKEFFFAKKILLLSFRVLKKGILYLLHVP
jgi:hypothetical protein